MRHNIVIMGGKSEKKKKKKIGTPLNVIELLNSNKKTNRNNSLTLLLLTTQYFSVQEFKLILDNALEVSLWSIDLVFPSFLFKNIILNHQSLACEWFF